MLSLKRVFVASAACGAMLGCEQLKSLTETGAASDTRQSFPAVWLTASWSGGRTGTPLDLKSVFPNNYVGALCPAQALILENHVTKYPAYASGDILLIGNNCNAAIWVAVCRTAGSGGGASPSIPLCATDPRLTSGGNFNIQRLGAGRVNPPYPFGTTPLGLDISVFFCSDKSDFNFNQTKPKAGAAPTDCVETP